MLVKIDAALTVRVDGNCRRRRGRGIIPARDSYFAAAYEDVKGQFSCTWITGSKLGFVGVNQGIPQSIGYGRQGITVLDRVAEWIKAVYRQRPGLANSNIAGKFDHPLYTIHGCLFGDLCRTPGVRRNTVFDEETIHVTVRLGGYDQLVTVPGGDVISMAVY